MCTFIIFFYKSPFQYISFTSIIILGIIKFYLKEMTTIAIKKIINNYDCTAVHSMLMQKISNGTKIGLKLLIYKMIHLVNLVIPFTVGSEAIQVYNRTVLAFFSKRDYQIGLLQTLVLALSFSLPAPLPLSSFLKSASLQSPPLC